MLETEMIKRLITDQYGSRPSTISDLQNYVFDWRGTYRIDHADGTAWVVRVINRAEAADAFAGTAMRPLSAQERRLLPAALPFWLAFSAADYAEGTEVLAPDDLFFQKLRVRLAAAEAIGDLARQDT